MKKLQKLQNAAVRLIFNLPPRSPVSEKYIDLELLQINQMIIFKCLMLVHKFFTNKAPEAMKNLLRVQSGVDRSLVVKYYSSSYALKSFSFAAPRYWNKLPIMIRLTDSTATFKRLLKLALLENQNNILSSTTGYYFLPR